MAFRTLADVPPLASQSARVLERQEGVSYVGVTRVEPSAQQKSGVSRFDGRFGCRGKQQPYWGLSPPTWRASSVEISLARRFSRWIAS